MAESTENSEADLSTNGDAALPGEKLIRIESSLDSDFSYSELKLDSSSAGIVPTVTFLDEICTKHIPEINDDLRSHPYYFYPPVEDPGISRTLHDPEPIVTYEDDGQKKYVFMCQMMNHLVVKKFYKELLRDKIDLKYYGISSNWMRAMCDALQNNRTITALDLTDNWLNSDACFHLNEVIENNKFLTSINLNGCRIGPEGARRLAAGIQVTKKLKELNLSYNELGDEGIVALAPAMTESVIQKYDFSHNNLKILSGQELAMALMEKITITDLDLSWNFIENKGMVPLLKALKTNPLENLNISWNGLFETKIEGPLMMLMKRPNMKIFDISNNQLKGEVVVNVSNWLWKAKNLKILRLGNNQLTSDDAIAILWNYQNRRVKCNILDLGQTNVTPEFVDEVENLKNMKTRKDALVIFGHVIGNYTIVGPDPKKLAFERAKYVAETKKKKNFGLQANIRKKKIKQDDFAKLAESDGIFLDADLISYLCKQFANKKKQLDIAGMADCVMQLWPETKLVLLIEEKELPPAPVEETKGKDKQDKDKKGKDKKKKK